MTDSLDQPLSEEELCPNDLLLLQQKAYARDIEKLDQIRDSFQQVPCPACTAEEHQFAFEKYGFQTQRCLNCQTLYTSPRPGPEQLEEYYETSENSKLWASHIFPASEASRKEKIHRPWLARVLGYCETFSVPTQRLAEVGPGYGIFSELAQNHSPFEEVFAIEPTPGLAEACRSKGLQVLEKRVEDIDENDLPPLDVLVSFEVIEHLHTPRDFIRQCHRLLKPGGLLILSCPNGQGFDVQMLQAGSLAVDFPHINLFNPGAMQAMLEELGFAVCTVETPGRLDAEFVRDAALRQEYAIPSPFLQQVLIDEWDRLGWPFQQFLAQNQLSAHMWSVSRKSAESC